MICKIANVGLLFLRLIFMPHFSAYSTTAYQKSKATQAKIGLAHARPKIMRIRP